MVVYHIGIIINISIYITMIFLDDYTYIYIFAYFLINIYLHPHIEGVDKTIIIRWFYEALKCGL